MNEIEFSNPYLKDRIRITENSKSKLAFRTFLAAGGGQTELHYHSKIHEAFTIIKGELNVILNKEEKQLTIGERFVIPPYTHHRFYNASGKEVIFDVEIQNPKKMMNALQIMYGLTEDKKTNSKGLPNNILHTAIAINLMDTFTPKLPHHIQKLGIYTLSKIGKLIGLEKQLIQKYCLK